MSFRSSFKPTRVRATPRFKARSGGEKARILLALDCLRCALTRSTPSSTMRSTPVWEDSRQPLRACGQQSQDVQVLVVTHQASVAAAAHQHLRATSTPPKAEHTSRSTNGAEREREVVRMTSGDVVVDAAQVVARALLDEGGERATV